RGQGPRRARSDGRDLLQERRHSADRRGRQILRFGHLDRKRRLGRAGRAHHPDRCGLRVVHGAPRPRLALATRDARGRRGRRRHRRHVQYAHRRGALRRARPLPARPPASEPPARGMPVVSPLALLPAYLVLGGIMAVVSAVFIRALYAAEDFFEGSIPNREYLRHVIGMLGVGVLAASFMRVTGHYYVEGVGYSTIFDILSGTLDGAGFLVILFAAKLLATSLTLGSGASGGVFSPSLFMGAALGGAYGVALRTLFPGLHVVPAAFALAGMAGVVAGATGAALTAIVMIFEMTLDYSVVL